MIFLPNYVKNCIKTLEKEGFSAYCVGGAVRDMLANRPAHDFDLATDCPPDRVQKIFPRTVPTGVAHGTVTVVTEGGAIEVTTFRTETGYSDNRHPDSVRFVGSIEDDLSRRDFTVNAIAYNPKTGIVDPFSGEEDIKRGVLRAVGDPKRRFSEDALRVARLFRFASQLGFTPEENTQKAAEEAASDLSSVSAERIFSELCKTFLGERLELAAPLFRSGGLAPFGVPVCDITPAAALPARLEIRFLWLCRKAGSADMLDLLKADGALKKAVSSRLRLCELPPPESREDIKRLLSLEDERSLRDRLIIDSLPEEPLDQVLSSGEPYKISHLALDGYDLKALGVTGKKTGDALKALLCAVIENPSFNTRERLSKLITNRGEKS